MMKVNSVEIWKIFSAINNLDMTIEQWLSMEISLYKEGISWVCRNADKRILSSHPLIDISIREAVAVYIKEYGKVVK
jgi:hypothetical protein